jgi:hypothetical protein
MPAGHPALAACLNNLGNMLESRLKQTGSTEDLEEAIHKAKQAVDASSLAICLDSFGDMLESQFEQTGNMENLDEESTNRSKQLVSCLKAIEL